MPHSVVIVEDEIAVAQLLADYLGQCDDFQVLGIATDKATASRLVALGQPELLLLDIHLPDGNGLELLGELRRQGVGSDVIMVTAAKEVAALEKAMQLGAFDFLVKPIMLARLDQALAKFRARHQQLQQGEVLTQSLVDKLLGTDSGAGVASDTRLPKGIDAVTLSKVRQLFQEDPQAQLSAEKVGALIGASRSTARRYLEFLLTQHELVADLSYGSIGRPERCYHWRR